jgi:hypothetical protein
VKDPRDVIILDGKEERQGDYILTANHLGEYAFCFENDMSTITEKLVDFDIMVCGWPYLISVEDGQLTLVDRWRVNQERRHQGSPQRYAQQYRALAEIVSY